MLEELPSDLPILLFGTTSTQLAEIDDNPTSIFAEHNVYVLVLSKFPLISYFFSFEA